VLGVTVTVSRVDADITTVSVAASTVIVLVLGPNVTVVKASVDVKTSAVSSAT